MRIKNVVELFVSIIRWPGLALPLVHPGSMVGIIFCLLWAHISSVL